MVNSTTMEDDTKGLVTTNVVKIIRVAENTKMVKVIMLEDNTKVVEVTMVLRVAMVLEVTMAVEAKWCKDDTKLVVVVFDTLVF